jgi:peroxiredoxin
MFFILFWSDRWLYRLVSGQRQQCFNLQTNYIRCDLEAHTFAELKDKFKAAGATIIGVSADDIQRLNSFSSNPDYCAGKFPVASDPEVKLQHLMA